MWTSDHLAAILDRDELPDGPIPDDPRLHWIVAADRLDRWGAVFEVWRNGETVADNTSLAERSHGEWIDLGGGGTHGEGLPWVEAGLHTGDHRSWLWGGSTVGRDVDLDEDGDESGGLSAFSGFAVPGVASIAVDGGGRHRSIVPRPVHNGFVAVGLVPFTLTPIDAVGSVCGRTIEVRY